MQATRGHSMRDRSPPQPDCFELAPRQDAMLPRRQTRELAVERVLDEFCTYVVHFSSFAGHAPRLAGKSARVTRAS
jgi:hypothetical protein